VTGEKVAQFADATNGDEATDRVDTNRQIRLQAVKERQSILLW